MSAQQSGALLDHIRRLAGGRELDRLTDQELLGRYAAGDEPAFAALVRRHGPMVWHVCRRGLRQAQDAEDVFQATFLVLARKAGDRTVRWRPSIAPWLYAVAQRLVSKARSLAARPPRPLPAAHPTPDPLEEMTARDLLTALDDELAALPETYRGPIVLCLLEGQTQEQAATILQLPLITLRRRLERAKTLLHARLTRRGLAPSVALGVLALAQSSAPAAPPVVLAASARPRACALAAPLLAAPQKITPVFALVLVLCAAATGLGLLTSSSAPPPPASKPAPPPRSQDAGERVAVDALGDPLPPGALLRLGSIRLRHGGTVQSVACSPDGKLLASGGWDPAVRLWDPETGKELRQITSLARGVYAVAFSPDGKRLAGAGVDQVVCVWDVTTGKELRRFPGHRGEVRAVAFSPRGDLLAAGDSAGVRVWEVDGGKARHVLGIKEGGVHAVTFSPDGATLAAGSGGGVTVRLWDVGAGRLLHGLSGHTDAVTSIAFSRDSKTLITTASDKVLHWDVATGKKGEALGTGGNAVVLSPDGKRLAVAGRDGRVRLFDWPGMKEVMKTRRHPDYTRSVTFSPDGRTLTTVADGGTMYQWDTATGRPRGLPRPGHEGRLVSLAYGRDGKTIVTTAWDGTVRLWDARSGKEVRRIDVELGNEDHIVDPATMADVSLSPDGRLLAAVRGGSQVEVWDAAGKSVYRFNGTCVAFSPDGKRIACGGREVNAGVVRLYDAATGKSLREMRGHLTALNVVTFSADGKTLFSRGQRLFGFRTGEPGESETRFVRAWNVATGEERPAPAGGAGSESVTLSPDGRTVARVDDMGKTVVLWESATAGRRAELKGHAEMLFAVAFSPDSRTVATGSMDGSVRLWDALTGETIARLEGHRSWVLTLAFSPDGRRLVSGGIDSTGLVWDVARYTGRRENAKELADEVLMACWKDLDAEPATASRAMGRLVADPARSVEFLRRQVRPARPVDAEPVKRLIAELASERFATRERATKELERMGTLAAPALRQALAAGPPLEVRRRLEALLAKLEAGRLGPEVVRLARAVAVLEHAGTPEARRLLAELAAGAPEGFQTREAAEALKRLAR